MRVCAALSKCKEWCARACMYDYQIAASIKTLGSFARWCVCEVFSLRRKRISNSILYVLCLLCVCVRVCMYNCHIAVIGSVWKGDMCVSFFCAANALVTAICTCSVCMCLICVCMYECVRVRMYDYHSAVSIKTLGPLCVYVCMHGLTFSSRFLYLDGLEMALMSCCKKRRWIPRAALRRSLCQSGNNYIRTRSLSRTFFSRNFNICWYSLSHTFTQW